MVIELTVGCHELLLKNVEVFGNELVEVNAPDLTAEAGPSVSQRFMRCSNWSGIRARRLSSPLLASLYLSLKSVCFGMSNDYYPQSCCLSLYHAFVKHLGVWLEIGGDDRESAAYFFERAQSARIIVVDAEGCLFRSRILISAELAVESSSIPRRMLPRFMQERWIAVWTNLRRNTKGRRRETRQPFVSFVITSWKRQVLSESRRRSLRCPACSRTRRQRQDPAPR